MQHKENSLAYFVPEYGNYYHFMAESMMGLYRLLRDHKQLEHRNCEIWYKGKYAEIIQLFSCRPIHVIDNIAQVPDHVTKLHHFRPNVHEDWLQLVPMRDYLMMMFPSKFETLGITVIQRRHRRVYSDHDELVSRLQEFGMPVREAVMETLSLENQVNLMRSTRVLVGPHGSGETNLMFMPKQSLILELYPKGFTDRVFVGLAKAFGHTLVEIESQKPSAIGRKPSAKVQEFFDKNGWPTRRDFKNWRPDCMEMGRVLRDVASFSIEPEIVVNRLRQFSNFFVE